MKKSKKSVDEGGVFWYYKRAPSESEAQKQISKKILKKSKKSA